MTKPYNLLRVTQALARVSKRFFPLFCIQFHSMYSYSNWSQLNFSSKYYNGESWKVTKFHFAHFLLLTTTFRRSSGWGWIGLEHFKWKKFQVYLNPSCHFRFLHIFTFAWCALLRSTVKSAYYVQWLLVLSNRLMWSQFENSIY